MAVIVKHVPVALALLAGHVYAPLGETLAFAPEKGSRLTKTFERELEVQLKEWDGEIELNGTIHVWPLDEMSCTESQRVVLQDEYLEIERERPRRLRRSFTELSGKLSGSTEGWINEKGHGMLEGAIVLFTLDEKESVYIPAFESSDGLDEELLEGLEEDTDLRSFLPNGEVSVGDEWDVEPGLLRLLCEPGGSIAYKDDEGRHRFLAPWLLGEMEGNLNLRFAGEPSVQGKLVALLEIEGTVSVETEPVETEGEVSVLFYSVKSTVCVSTKAEFVVEGEILWDLDAGHLLELVLDGDVVLERETYRKGHEEDPLLGDVWSRAHERWEGTMRLEGRFR